MSALAVSRFAEDGSQRSVFQNVDTVWDYTDDGAFDGVRLVAEFGNGKLVDVESYRRPWLREQIEELYRLEPNGSAHEGRDSPDRARQGMVVVLAARGGGSCARMGRFG